MNVTFLKWPVLYYFIWSVAFDEGGYITGQRDWHKAAEYGILCENINVLTIQDNIRNRGDILKFIHTADIHLGAAPDSGMPWAADRGPFSQAAAEEGTQRIELSFFTINPHKDRDSGRQP